MKVWKFSKDEDAKEELSSSPILEPICTDQSCDGEEKSLDIYQLTFLKYINLQNFYGSCLILDAYSARFIDFIKSSVFSRIKIGKRANKSRNIYVNLYARVKSKTGIGYSFIPIYVQVVDGEIYDFITGIKINTVIKPNCFKRYIIKENFKASSTEVANLIRSLSKKQIEDYKKSIEEFNEKVETCYNSFVQESNNALREKELSEEIEAESQDFLEEFQRGRRKERLEKKQ